MSETFKAARVTDRVWWVGAIDWGLRNFHGYETGRGTTYNAYLIMADEPILVDTVKAPFQDEMLERIASVVEPSKIRHVISNHTEMDHSGCLPRILEMLKPKTFIASAMGAKALKEHFHWNEKIKVAADGERISLAGADMQFFETRMLHWPDSMFTYLERDSLLFSNDGFGMHLASSERFEDELDSEVVRWEGAKYYANILLPFSGLVTKLIEKLPSLNLDIKIIAPDHGPIWRREPARIVKMYSDWAAQRPTRKAVIAFDTMWNSTALMARAMAEGLASGGSSVRVMPLQGSHRSDVVTEVLDASALLVGSPTMNNQVFPTMADLMVYLKGLKPKNKIGAAFGSFGWSGESIKHLDQTLSEMGVEVVADPISVRYVPDAGALARCYALGQAVAAKLKERAA